MHTRQTDILKLLPEQLAAELQALGEKSFRTNQILSWVYEGYVRGFAEMTNLSAGLRKQLAMRFTIGPGESVKCSRTIHGTTVKFLLTLPDNARVEAVSMREKNRHTACISSQVGCGMGCVFCATGKMGLVRNLTVGEILLQFLEISRTEGKINRIVFMGMGEPLLNLDNVLSAVAAFTDSRRFAVGGRRITISTCGIIPGIRELAKQNIPVRLALSLNSPFQEQREQLMPIAEKYPLADVLNACEDYTRATSRRITLEYVLLKDENTSIRAAREVVKIAARLDGKINLIEYNPIENSPFASPTKDETHRFRDCLEKAGIRVTIRFRRGRDIAAACGQLAGGGELRNTECGLRS